MSGITSQQGFEEFTQFKRTSGSKGFGNMEDSDFIFLRDGLNSILILSDPVFYKSHWATVSGSNTKLNCMVDSCILCSKYGPAKDRWFILAYSVDLRKIGVLDVPYTIIRGLFENKEYLYSHVIEINRTMSDDGYATYSVDANLDREIKDSHAEKIRKMLQKSEINVESLAKIPTLEEVKDRLRGLV